MKIKNRPDYLFDDNMIVNIKDFDSSLLEINKLSFKGAFSLNICYIKQSPLKSPNPVSIDRTDNDKVFLIFLMMMQMDPLKKTMELNIQFLLLQKKNKETLKNCKKLWEEIKRQIKVINDDESIKYRKDFMKIRFESVNGLPQGETFNIIGVIIFAASVLGKKCKYYPQFFLHE